MKKIMVSIKENTKDFFRFSGIASSESRDADGEIIKQKGINLSLVNQGKVIINAEHDNNSIGFVEFAEIRNNQLYIEGIVFIKTIKAQIFHKLLVENNPNKPVTLSIEFVNPEFSAKDKSVFNEVVLTGVALIGINDEPANKDTYVELLKSVSKDQLIEELVRRAQKSQSFRARLKEILSKTRQF